MHLLAGIVQQDCRELIVAITEMEGEAFASPFVIIRKRILQNLQQLEKEMREWNL